MYRVENVHTDDATFVDSGFLVAPDLGRVLDLAPYRSSLVGLRVGKG